MEAHPARSILQCHFDARTYGAVGSTRFSDLLSLGMPPTTNVAACRCGHRMGQRHGGPGRTCAAGWRSVRAPLSRHDIHAIDRSYCAVRYHSQASPAGACTRSEIHRPYKSQEAGNAAYLEYWREHFEIIKELDTVRRRLPIAKLAEDYPTVLFLDGEWQWVHDVASKVEDCWEAAGGGPLLKLPDEHRERAQVTLESHGLPRDAWFVTLHVRDSEYGMRRNGSIADYLPAIRRITDAGGWVMRLGNPLMTKLPEMPRVLDYAHADRQDWLDVYLIAAARFFIGTNSGPAWAAGTFGVPALLTNWAPIGIQSHYANTVTLPQLLWSEVENRPLSFTEQMTEPFAYGETSFVLERGGAASIANTSEDIACAVGEMLLRAHGEWSAPDGDEERQQTFKLRLREAGISGRSRIASGFLHKYADLLVHTR